MSLVDLFNIQNETYRIYADCLDECPAKIILPTQEILNTHCLQRTISHSIAISVSVSNETLPIKAHLLDWSNKTQCHYIPIVNKIQHQCIYTSHVIYIVHIVHIKYSFKKVKFIYSKTVYVKAICTHRRVIDYAEMFIFLLHLNRSFLASSSYLLQCILYINCLHSGSMLVHIFASKLLFTA